MKKKYIFIIILIVIAFLIYNGGCEFSTAKVSDAKVCTIMNSDLCDQDNIVLTGNPAEIYASCKLKNAPADTKIKFTWYYFGQTKTEITNVILDSADKGTELNLHSSLSRPTNGWPTGKYEVEIQIMVDSTDPLIKSFEIQ